ncbi:MAG: acyl-CoA dehydrogenase family protein [Promethearchaeota archaeon]
MGFYPIEGVKIIPEDVEEALKIDNLYEVLNFYLLPMLNEQETEFVLGLEEHVKREVAPMMRGESDVYSRLFPALGKGGYIQRLNPWRDYLPAGMEYEVLLGLVTAVCDPELDLARLASGILAGNPMHLHGGDEVHAARDEIYSGKKVGCICITERTRGSDAVNMLTDVKMGDDGSATYNGEKIFTTNGPKADYLVAYGVTEPSNPRASMVQTCISREVAGDGLETNRLGINSVPRVWIGQTIFKDLTMPKEWVLGGPGKGYEYLFEGLVPERISIVGSSLGICWLGWILGAIYTNIREQFGRKIFSFQDVSFQQGRWLTELLAATQLGLFSAHHHNKAIAPENAKNVNLQKFNASLASAAKMKAAKLSHDIAYENQQIMGGISVTDNMMMDRVLEISKIEEVIGGSRGIQTLLVSRSIPSVLKNIF